MDKLKVLVIDSDTDRHKYWKRVLENIHKEDALLIEENVFNKDHNNVIELNLSQRNIIDFTDMQIASNVRQTYINPLNYDVTVVHINNYLAKEDYIDHFKNKAVILVFSGGDLKGDWNKELVREIPIPLNVEGEFLSLNWKAAFEEFEKNKTKPFPVHLLKSSLHNTYAFLILLQGYIAANMPDGDEKNKLLPGWNGIKDKISINKPEQTQSEDWWDVVKQDTLLNELTINGKMNKILEGLITVFYTNYATPDKSNFSLLYSTLKGSISN